MQSLRILPITISKCWLVPGLVCKSILIPKSNLLFSPFNNLIQKKSMAKMRRLPNFMPIKKKPMDTEFLGGEKSNKTETSIVLNDKELVANTLSKIEKALNQQSLIFTRDYQWGSIVFGYEQANTYRVQNQEGAMIGYMVEESNLGKMFLRQLLETHRGFTVSFFDAENNPLLSFERSPYFLSSSLKVYLFKNTSEESPPSPEQAIHQLSNLQFSKELVGEVNMDWHPFRRKYSIFSEEKIQKYKVDVPMLSWDFPMQNEKEETVMSVNKDFRGLATELFTNANQYVVRFKDGDSKTKENIKERILALATAIAIDYDYFSHHGGGGPLGIFMPIVFPPSGAPSNEANIPKQENEVNSNTNANANETNPSKTAEDYWTFDKNENEEEQSEEGGSWLDED